MQAIKNLMKIQELLDPTLFAKIATSMRIMGPIIQTEIINTPISNDVRDFLRANNLVDRAFLDISPSLAAVSNNAPKSATTVSSVHHAKGVKSTQAASAREVGGHVDNPVDDEQRGGEDSESGLVPTGLDGEREKSGEGDATAGDKQAGKQVGEKVPDHEELVVDNSAVNPMQTQLGTRQQRFPARNPVKVGNEGGSGCRGWNT